MYNDDLLGTLNDKLLSDSILFQLDTVRSSGSSTQQQMTQLQEELSDMSVWKEKVTLSPLIPFMAVPIVHSVVQRVFIFKGHGRLIRSLLCRSTECLRTT